MGRIEWTDRSDWNPIRGCTRASHGCGGAGGVGGCYAEAMAARFSDPGQWGHGYAERAPGGGRWTGRVEVQWERMDLPLRWRKPAKIFASSTSDWFHEALPVDSIAALFAIAVAAVHVRRHTFQILTKRAARMREVLTSGAFWDQVNAEAGAHVGEYVDPLARQSDDARATLDDYDQENPPPGIWLGVSAEDQQRADERIPHLLATPAAVRFVSCEPLLGPIDLTNYIERCHGGRDGECNWARCPQHRDNDLAKGRHCPIDTWKDGDDEELMSPLIDWVITGGESGPRARPMHPDWARGLRDQCAAAQVPFFFKQWGEWIPAGQVCDTRGLSGNEPLHRWPDIAAPSARVGKSHAGCLLDGIERKAFPSTRAAR